MADKFDFATERGLRRPNELPHEIQETLNLCLDDQTGVRALDGQIEARVDYKSFYLRDLGKRMLNSFMSLGGQKVAKPIMKEFDQLSPAEQDIIEASLRTSGN